MNYKTHFLFLLILLLNSYIAQAQDSSKINITSSVGLISPQNSFKNAFSQSFSISSGLVLKLPKNFFINGTFSVNMLKYNQRQLDASSSYLFVNTTSPFIQSSLSIGKDLEIIKNKRLVFSPYIGFGGFMIMEPRLNVDLNKKVISKTVINHFSPHVLVGQRLYFNTKTKLLKTIFIDTFYWKSNLSIQDSKAQAFTFMVGIKINK